MRCRRPGERLRSAASSSDRNSRSTESGADSGVKRASRESAATKIITRPTATHRYAFAVETREEAGSDDQQEERQKIGA